MKQMEKGTVQSQKKQTEIFHNYCRRVMWGWERELKLEKLLGSNFHYRLERSVTNAPFVV